LRLKLNHAETGMLAQVSGGFWAAANTKKNTHSNHITMIKAQMMLLKTTFPFLKSWNPDPRRWYRLNRSISNRKRNSVWKLNLMDQCFHHSLQGLTPPLWHQVLL
jgi:hypothetical protein